MSQFITLKKNDPQFQMCMLGYFADNKMAIPIKHFMRDHSVESVTFELVDQENISWFRKFSAVLDLVRWPLLSLSVLPMLFVLLMLGEAATVQPYEYILALAALVFFHTSLFAWNDYRDHIHGWDIIRQKSGTRTIQKGLLTALQVKRIAWASLIISVILALPVLITKWPLFIFAAIAFGLAGATTLVKTHGRLKILMDQVAIFLSFGPLLVFGAKYFFIEEVLGAQTALFIFVSFFLGLSACLYMQSRQFSHLMADDRSEAMTLAVSLGFDGMKRLLILELLLLGVSIASFVYLFEFGFWTWFCSLPVFFWLIRLSFLTRSCESPLSSKMNRLPSYYLATHWLLCLWLIVEASF